VVQRSIQRYDLACQDEEWVIRRINHRPAYWSHVRIALLIEIIIVTITSSISQWYLQSVSESLKTLDDLATRSCALVRPPELQVHEQSNDNNETSGNHASSDARHVVRSILSAENSATDDSTNTTSTNESSRAESTLPLTADVVSLPCEDAGNIGVGRSSSEEDTEVAEDDC
jgi:hypothetical protein